MMNFMVFFMMLVVLAMAFFVLVMLFMFFMFATFAMTRSFLERNTAVFLSRMIETAAPKSRLVI